MEYKRNNISRTSELQMFLFCISYCLSKILYVGSKILSLFSLASRVKMGKKVEKGAAKEKNQSATSQDETDSNKALGKENCYICIFILGCKLTSKS